MRIEGDGTQIRTRKDCEFVFTDDKTRIKRAIGRKGPFEKARGVQK